MAKEETSYLTKICKKCKNEYPVNRIYFPPDKGCKDGYRGICKICSKETKKFNLNLLTDSPFIWDRDLEETLIENFIGKGMTYKEILKLDEFKSLTKKKLTDKMSRLRKQYPERNLYKKEVHKNLKYYKFSKEQELFLIKDAKNFTNREILNMELFSDVTLESLCNKIRHLKNIGHDVNSTKETRKRGYYESMESRDVPLWEYKRTDYHKKMLSNRVKGKWSGKNNPQFGKDKNGKLNPNWKGGKTPFYFELRTQIDKWKNNTMEFHKYNCFITGKNFDQIHHLYPFRDIVNEVFESLDIEARQASGDYSESEFKLITLKLEELHDKYGLGVCLTEDIHRDFHNIYGYFNNTKEQFIEYCEKYHGIDFYAKWNEKYSQ